MKNHGNWFWLQWIIYNDKLKRSKNKSKCKTLKTKREVKNQRYMYETIEQNYDKNDYWLNSIVSVNKRKIDA